MTVTAQKPFRIDDHVIYHRDDVIIRQIGFSGSWTHFDYELVTPNGNHRYLRGHSCGPPPEIKKAMEGLAPHVIDNCELPDKSRDNILDVSLSYTDGITGITITHWKRLAQSKAPTVVKTLKKYCLTEDQITVIETLIEAARDFLIEQSVKERRARETPSDFPSPIVGFRCEI